MLDYYHVLFDKETGKVGIYYTDSLDPESFRQEFDEDIDTKIEIPRERWSETICKEILEGEFENANYHSFIDAPQMILDAIKEAGIPDHVRSEIMRLMLVKFQKLL